MNFEEWLKQRDPEFYQSLDEGWGHKLVGAGLLGLAGLGALKGGGAAIDAMRGNASVNTPPAATSSYDVDQAAPVQRHSMFAPKFLGAKESGGTTYYAFQVAGHNKNRAIAKARIAANKEILKNQGNYSSTTSMRGNTRTTQSQYSGNVQGLSNHDVKEVGDGTFVVVFAHNPAQAASFSQDMQNADFGLGNYR